MIENCQAAISSKRLVTPYKLQDHRIGTILMGVQDPVICFCGRLAAIALILARIGMCGYVHIRLSPPAYIHTGNKKVLPCKPFDSLLHGNKKEPMQRKHFSSTDTNRPREVIHTAGCLLYCRAATWHAKEFQYNRTSADGHTQTCRQTARMYFAFSLNLQRVME